MKRLCLPLMASMALLSSCASIDEYQYGYAPAYRTLPAGFKQAELGGKTYWHHGGRFYRHDADRGYLLVKPPRGHTKVVAGESGSPTPTADAASKPEPSWIAPGGGTIRERGRLRTTGRSPIRRRLPVTGD